MLLIWKIVGAAHIFDDRSQNITMIQYLLWIRGRTLFDGNLSLSRYIFDRGLDITDPLLCVIVLVFYAVYSISMRQCRIQLNESMRPW